MLIVALDSRAFQKTFREKVAQSTRSFQENVNGTAFSIAQEAIKLTKPAQRAEIEALGITSVTMGKRGRLLKRGYNRYDPTPRFLGIYIAHLKKIGKSPRDFANRAALISGAERALGARLRSISYLASGWIPALRAFASVLHRGFYRGSARQFGVKKGRAIVAKHGWNPMAEFANSAGGSEKDPLSAARVREVLSSAALAAFAAEIPKMRQHIIDKQNGVWKK